MLSKRFFLSVLYVTVFSLTLSCEDFETGLGDNYGEDLDSRAAVGARGCLPSRDISWRYRSGDGLPLGQSRPGANVTLFFDFDGGSFSGVSSGKASSSYDSKEQAHIEKQVEQVAGNYERWSINVTTDKAVFDRANKRARIFIANGEGSSGMASTDGISSSSKYTGYVGADAVFDSGSSGYKCAYVMTHEFGHNFTLRGTTKDYADMYPRATIGAFMGGRDSQFDGYDWIALTNKNGEWQDPNKIIGKIAGTISGPVDNTSSCDGKCSSSCRCDIDEGDCDQDADCKSGLYCEQQSGTDYCQAQTTTSSCDGKCSSSCRCDIDEGDCDQDADCKSGLYCEQQSGTDYCQAQTTTSSCDGKCSSSCRCDIDEGDCDRNTDCKSGLYCKQQSGTDYCRRR